MIISQKWIMQLCNYQMTAFQFKDLEKYDDQMICFTYRHMK